MTVSRTVAAIAFFVLVLPPPLSAAEEADAIAWLERMVRAAHELDYEGTFVYRGGGQMQSMRVMHSNTAEGERERLVSLSGPLREVLRDGDRVACIVPEGLDKAVVQTIAPAGAMPLKLPNETSVLSRYYHIELEDIEQIAGQPARKVAIRPKDEYRYGRNYWIATDSGLLLHSTLLDVQGQVVEEVLFTQLAVHDRLPPKLLEPEHEGGRYVWQRSPESHHPGWSAGWQVKEPPPGFQMTVSRRATAQDGGPRAHLVFSDGLAAVSVFIEPDNVPQAFVGRSRRGALNVEVRRLDGHRVTVIGEVPAATVKRLAEQVVRRESGP